jgi:hypothetical protein
MTGAQSRTKIEAAHPDGLTVFRSLPPSKLTAICVIRKTRKAQLIAYY